MNTAEFIEYWAAKNGETPTEAERKIKEFISTFQSAVAESGKLDIRGYASAEVVNRAARECYDPRNQQKIKTKGKRLIKMKISPKFKNMLEG